MIFLSSHLYYSPSLISSFGSLITKVSLGPNSTSCLCLQSLSDSLFLAQSCHRSRLLSPCTTSDWLRLPLLPKLGSRLLLLDQLYWTRVICTKHGHLQLSLKGDLGGMCMALRVWDPLSHFVRTPSGKLPLLPWCQLRVTVPSPHPSPLVVMLPWHILNSALSHSEVCQFLSGTRMEVTVG